MSAVDADEQSQIVAMESKRRLIRRKKMPKNAGQKKLNNPYVNKKMIIRGHYDSSGEEISLYELLKELKRLVCGPVQNLREMDGDMYISDYQKLTEAEWRILSVLRSIEGEK